MKPLRSAGSGLLLVSGLAAGLQAQSPAPVITTARVDSNTTWHKSEMALAVSPSTPDIMAAWHEHAPGFTNVYYTVSTDGYSFGVNTPNGYEPSALVPLPVSWTELHGADPIVAFAQDGRGWVSYVGRNPALCPPQIPSCQYVDRAWVALKYSGDSALQTATPTIMGFRADKDWLVAGPDVNAPPGSSDVLSLLYSIDNSGNWGPYSIYAQWNPPLGVPSLAVDSTGSPGTDGAVILRGGPYHGQLVVGYHRAGDNLRVKYSPDAGAHWYDGVGPRSTRDPVNPTHPNQAFSQGWKPQTSAQPGAVDNSYFLSLASDPTNPSNVYMAFVGNPPASDLNNKADIYIARSTDGGRNFDYDPLNEVPGQRVLRLRSIDLGDPANSLHTLPSISVDDWGGVHVLYYAGRWHTPCDECPGYWLYKVRLINIPQFDTILHTNQFSVYDITPYEFRLDHPSVPGHDTEPFVGHYMNTCAARGCQVWMGYIAPPAEGGPAGVYVASALIPNSVCVADPNCYANCDGSSTTPVLNINDFICFLERYAEGNTYANCDGSTTPPILNVSDHICFMQRYSAGCR